MSEKKLQKVPDEPVDVSQQDPQGLIRSSMWGRNGVIISFFFIVFMALCIMYIDRLGLKKKDSGDDIRSKNEQVSPAPERE